MHLEGYRLLVVSRIDLRPLLRITQSYLGYTTLEDQKNFAVEHDLQRTRERQQPANYRQVQPVELSVIGEFRHALSGIAL